MVNIFLADSACFEITVEDPNELFDDMRDLCDFARLIRSDALTEIKLNSDINPNLTANRTGVNVPTSKLVNTSLLANLRKEHKITTRQFSRLVELYLLSTIPVHSRQAGTARITKKARASDPGDRAYYYWRLLVKQRIYRQNMDKLLHVDKHEGIDHIEQTVTGQGDEYERLLRTITERSERDVETDAPETDVPGAGNRRAKRKHIVDDDEEDDEDENGHETDGESSAKRRKESGGRL